MSTLGGSTSSARGPGQEVLDEISSAQQYVLDLQRRADQVLFYSLKTVAANAQKEANDMASNARRFSAAGGALATSGGGDGSPIGRDPASTITADLELRIKDLTRQLEAERMERAKLQEQYDQATAMLRKSYGQIVDDYLFATEQLHDRTKQLEGLMETATATAAPVAVTPLPATSDQQPTWPHPAPLNCAHGEEESQPQQQRQGRQEFQEAQNPPVPSLPHPPSQHSGQLPQDDDLDESWSPLSASSYPACAGYTDRLLSDLANTVAAAVREPAPPSPSAAAAAHEHPLPPARSNSSRRVTGGSSGNGAFAAGVGGPRTGPSSRSSSQGSSSAGAGSSAVGSKEPSAAAVGSDQLFASEQVAPAASVQQQQQQQQQRGRQSAADPHSGSVSLESTSGRVVSVSNPGPPQAARTRSQSPSAKDRLWAGAGQEKHSPRPLSPTRQGAALRRAQVVTPREGQDREVADLAAARAGVFQPPQDATAAARQAVAAATSAWRSDGAHHGEVVSVPSELKRTLAEHPSGAELPSATLGGEFKAPASGFGPAEPACISAATPPQPQPRSGNPFTRSAAGVAPSPFSSGGHGPVSRFNAAMATAAAAAAGASGGLHATGSCVPSRPTSDSSSSTATVAAASSLHESDLDRDREWCVRDSNRDEDRKQEHRREQSYRQRPGGIAAASGMPVVDAWPPATTTASTNTTTNAPRQESANSRLPAAMRGLAEEAGMGPGVALDKHGHHQYDAGRRSPVGPAAAAGATSRTAQAAARAAASELRAATAGSSGRRAWGCFNSVSERHGDGRPDVDAAVHDSSAAAGGPSRSTSKRLRRSVSSPAEHPSRRSAAVNPGPEGVSAKLSEDSNEEVHVGGVGRQSSRRVAACHTGTFMEASGAADVAKPSSKAAAAMAAAADSPRHRDDDFPSRRRSLHHVLSVPMSGSSGLDSSPTAHGARNPAHPTTAATTSTVDPGCIDAEASEMPQLDLDTYLFRMRARSAAAAAAADPAGASASPSQGTANMLGEEATAAVQGGRVGSLGREVAAGGSGGFFSGVSRGPPMPVRTSGAGGGAAVATQAASSPLLAGAAAAATAGVFSRSTAAAAAAVAAATITPASAVLRPGGDGCSATSSTSIEGLTSLVRSLRQRLAGMQDFDFGASDELTDDGMEAADGTAAGDWRTDDELDDGGGDAGVDYDDESVLLDIELGAGLGGNSFGVYASGDDDDDEDDNGQGNNDIDDANDVTYDTYDRLYSGTFGGAGAATVRRGGGGATVMAAAGTSGSTAMHSEGDGGPYVTQAFGSGGATGGIGSATSSGGLPYFHGMWDGGNDSAGSSAAGTPRGGIHDYEPAAWAGSTSPTSVGASGGSRGGGGGGSSEGTARYTERSRQSHAQSSATTATTTATTAAAAAAGKSGSPGFSRRSGGEVRTVGITSLLDSVNAATLGAAGTAPRSAVRTTSTAAVPPSARDHGGKGVASQDRAAPPPQPQSAVAAAARAAAAASVSSGPAVGAPGVGCRSAAAQPDRLPHPDQTSPRKDSTSGLARNGSRKVSMRSKAGDEGTRTGLGGTGAAAQAGLDGITGSAGAGAGFAAARWGSGGGGASGGGVKSAVAGSSRSSAAVDASAAAATAGGGGGGSTAAPAIKAANTTPQMQSLRSEAMFARIKQQLDALQSSFSQGLAPVRGIDDASRRTGGSGGSSSGSGDGGFERGTEYRSAAAAAAAAVASSVAWNGKTSRRGSGCGVQEGGDGGSSSGGGARGSQGDWVSTSSSDGGMRRGNFSSSAAGSSGANSDAVTGRGWLPMREGVGVFGGVGDDWQTLPGRGDASGPEFHGGATADRQVAGDGVSASFRRKATAAVAAASLHAGLAAGGSGAKPHGIVLQGEGDG
ncbi:hypothetical protein VOLCADRAFT_116789 [Volvox carteri f. nagariensis]|uniref:Uncharacterized protein n=1 Tax=Volvox carteri f. nagariensis TaxID=3068 RepID=D8TPF4_VOLCA|nr:uncharacterized protein VOLCADRAFT_116789 [Volvox carteri f. nagariensis]EFJ50755.1 hypothetical protein VOLCADRAFT_116789 [Volvox carteri f. nagariensis]|eukprot:XP_002948348.1 hypothetical protein VOLCADRAFT_116789 [Volvox carteri f. nagariensis]